MREIDTLFVLHFSSFTGFNGPYLILSFSFRL